MDFDKNADYYDDRNNPLAYKIKGLSYKFTSEASYVEPVSLADMKNYGLIDFATDDTILSQFITSARQQAEKYLQQSLGIRTVQFKALECPKNYRLAWGPIASITTENFTAFGDILKEGGKEITVTYTTDSSLVNDDIKIAICIQALHLYQNRERFFGGGQEISSFVDGFKEKLNPYRYLVYP